MYKTNLFLCFLPLFFHVQGKQVCLKEALWEIEGGSETHIQGMTCCLSENKEVASFDRIAFPKKRCCPSAVNPIFDVRFYLCNGTTVIPKTKDLDQCGLNMVYNTTLFACRWKTKSSREVEIIRLPSVVPPSQPVEIPSIQCTPDDYNCCGGKLLNRTQLCSQTGKIIKKEDLNDDGICDESKTFNTETHECIDGAVIQKQPGFSVCGGRHLYNLKLDLCCLGVQHQSALQNGFECCGTNVVSSSQICCFDKVYEKKKGFTCHDNKYHRELDSINQVIPLHVAYFRSEQHRRQPPATNGLCTYIGKLIFYTDSNLGQPNLKNNVKLTVAGNKKCKQLRRRWYGIITKNTLDGKQLELEKKNKVTPVSKWASARLQQIFKALKNN